MKHLKNSQHGLASIIIVFMLTIIISLLSLGFSRLMDRAIQTAAGNDLNAAADYAVRVGITEAASYLRAFPLSGSTTCDQLTKPGQPLSRVGGLSGDDNVKYTCVLINTAPHDVFYQLLTPYKSQVSKLDPNENMDQMMVSWEASDPTKNVFPSNFDKGLLFDETYWGDKNYPPLLRLTIYPLSGSKNDGGRTAWNELKATTKTVYLAPYSNKAPYGDTGAPVTRVNWNSLADGSIIPVNCGADNIIAQPPAPAFVGEANKMDCNMIFFNLPPRSDSKDSPYIYYARITPLYTTGTNVRIQGQAGGQLVTFKGTQSIVDVTAKAGNAAKRLQARVNIISAEFVDPQLRPSEDAAPEYAVRSAGTICKVFVVPQNRNTAVTIPDNIAASGAYAGACPITYPDAE